MRKSEWNRKHKLKRSLLRKKLPMTLFKFEPANTKEKAIPLWDEFGAIELMDEYAKAISIQFINWIREKDWIQYEDGFWWYNDKTPELTTEQLLEKFKAEKGL